MTRMIWKKYEEKPLTRIHYELYGDENVEFDDAEVVCIITMDGRRLIEECTFERGKFFVHGVEDYDDEVIAWAYKNEFLEELERTVLNGEGD